MGPKNKSALGQPEANVVQREASVGHRAGPNVGQRVADVEEPKVGVDEHLANRVKDVDDKVKAIDDKLVETRDGA